MNIFDVQVLTFLVNRCHSQITILVFINDINYCSFSLIIGKIDDDKNDLSVIVNRRKVEIQKIITNHRKNDKSTSVCETRIELDFVVANIMHKSGRFPHAFSHPRRW
uniref:Uncharacterized protein n=1 Tax=Micromonas pusilla TaxID=38833 RepID=A0A7S0PNN6_MICPS